METPTAADETPAVLLVDDRADNLLALEAVLEPLDLRLRRATSGRDALRRLLTEEFALIVLDVQMPDLDGFETARHIKERPKTRNIPIIFLTAINHELEHQLRGYGTGAVEYLAKPFQPDVLRAKVRVFVELHEQARTIERQNELLAIRLDELDRAQQSLMGQTRELDRSNAELRSFASAVASELRDPLHTARGFLDLLLDAGPPKNDDEQVTNTELAQRAESCVNGVLGLLDELEAYAAVSTTAIHREPVALGDVVAEAEGQLREKLDTTGATVTTDPLPTVTGDRWLLVRLFVELLDNAVEFRGADPLAVHVGVSQRDGRWVLTVHDNGIGIEPEELPRLFTMFARGHPREAHDGPGLGLATCRRVVERMGGAIWAESAAGKGTSVSVVLPAGGEDE